MGRGTVIDKISMASCPREQGVQGPLSQYLSEILWLSGKLSNSADQIFNWYDHPSNAKFDSNAVSRELFLTAIFVSLPSKRRLALNGFSQHFGVRGARKILAR